MAGGNTDNVYAGDDLRKCFAESLRDQHPDVVKVVWKFERWHHLVDYQPFAKNRPILRDSVVLGESSNEYGMKLVQKQAGIAAADDD